MQPFPISDATPIQHDTALPETTDVVVIGGGVMGVMTAWFLAEKGLRVTVLEKGRIAGEQSSRNWGWIRQQGRDPAELPIMMESLRLWQGLSAQLGAGLGFQQTGVMYLTASDKDQAGYESWLDQVKGSGVDSRMLSRAEVQKLMPDTKAAWQGGLWTASDARAEPWQAVPLIAKAAAAKGIVIRENCAVRCLDLAAGRVAGVVTEAGRIACTQVVVAAGAWSRLFLGAHGVKIPQLAVRSSVLATETLPEVFAGAAVDNRFAFRRRADGGYSLAPGDHHDFYIGRDAFGSFKTYLPLLSATLSHTSLQPMAPKGFPDAWSTPRWLRGDLETPFERMRVLNPKPNLRVLQRVAQNFSAAFPSLGPVKIKCAWAGMIDTMPDVVPVIDHAPIPGLTIATGLCGHGFGIGPGFGRVVADLVTGGSLGHDLSRFRLSRFSDGSKLIPGPAL